ncbi:MAG: hypothetical protein HYS17_06690 [Micavibrio aeruginosavorus]|uniref:Uncharacterized protein n=1 Tax=Micavibrio aeruginosavorus TaxID=349221 RepID=A0A7T5R0G9_9BACT|nr:MAG: hypothetical protein HYS17_06690 [Micavibrio aeruginosavorus]
MRKSAAIDILVLGMAAFIGGFGVNGMLAGTGMAEEIRARTNFFRVADAYNRKGIEMYVDRGSPGQVFYDMDEGMRLQMGIYPPNPQHPPKEIDLPLMALSDQGGEIRLLCRLDGIGTNNSPLVIMKDSKGQNRLIMGLALADEGEEAFLTAFDAAGKQIDVVGRFVNPAQAAAEKKGLKLKLPWQKG